MPRLMLTTARKLKNELKPGLRALARDGRDRHWARHVLERHLADDHVRDHLHGERRHLPGLRDAARQRLEHTVTLLRAHTLRAGAPAAGSRSRHRFARSSCLCRRPSRSASGSASSFAGTPDVDRDRFAGPRSNELDPVLPGDDRHAVRAQHLVVDLEAGPLGGRTGGDAADHRGHGRPGRMPRPLNNAAGSVSSASRPRTSSETSFEVAVGLANREVDARVVEQLLEDRKRCGLPGLRAGAADGFDGVVRLDSGARGDRTLGDGADQRLDARHAGREHEPVRKDREEEVEGRARRAGRGSAARWAES